MWEFQFLSQYNFDKISYEFEKMDNKIEKDFNVYARAVEAQRVARA